MKNRLNVIIAATIAIMGTSLNIASAETNSLIQMDVKRSSVTDTVDVTFYTTANTANSVVTRKTNNRYVVLLPNTLGSEAVSPNFGSVKDMITDIDVKHVDDGMGGYTKVTFSTTKPINIKTHMAKTSPLTQTQKEARALIAKSNSLPQPVTGNKQSSQQNTTTQTPISQQQSIHKPTVSQTPPKSQGLPKLISIDFPKSKIATNVSASTTPKQESIKKTVVQQPTTSQPKTNIKKTLVQDAESSYVPKMKYDNNGKRILDLEPRINHTVTTETKAVLAEETSAPVSADSVLEEQVSAPEIRENTPVQESNSADFPYWILYMSGTVVLLGILYLVFDAAKHSADKDKSRLESFFDISAKNQVKRRKKEYYDIVNNEELNWQEKYKKYNEKEEANKPQKHVAAMSYVTDMSGLKKSPTNLTMKDTPVQQEEKTHNDIVNEKMKAKMLELEQSYNAPSAQKDVVSEEKVQSEDDAILKSFNDIKLKSFSKPMSLKETQRTSISDNKNNSRNTSYKEGKFVKLKTTSKQVQNSNSLETSDLINTGNKYLPKKELRMNKNKEDYLLSSLDEYLSILDSEDNSRYSPAPKVKMPTSEAMTRSGMSNPISSTYNNVPKPTAQQETKINGLIVKSGHNIDADKGFYLVSLDGVSAIVGRIKDNIFILKKFDKVIDDTLQVRRDDGTVYIVKLGKFKCLVNVEHDKMGTLIEI